MLKNVCGKKKCKLITKFDKINLQVKHRIKPQAGMSSLL